jgi:asparagine synthase (glutamine-hydrolysing)
MCGFFIKIKNKISSGSDYSKFLSAGKLLSHRGPDDTHRYSDKYIDILFYRLSLRDLSKNGRQPMLSRSGRYLICFNGEIYNSKQISEKYLKSKILKGNSDTEILIESYEIAGKKILSELEGMFSIFVYDRKEKIYFVARDRFGIKPLYYFSNSEYLLFSSEIKPIINYTKNNIINNIALAEFFLKGLLDHDKTLFENIILFPAGFFAVVKKFNMEFERYWELKEKENNLNLKVLKSEIEYLFNDSIRKHLVSDKKIGLFLSGGTDSSLIAQQMKKNINYKTETFTYDFVNSKKFSEQMFAKSISRKLNFKNNLEIVDYNFVNKNFENLINIVESPITSLRLFGIMKNYESAAKKNFSVIFEGHGGDEQFGGYKYNYLFNILENFRISKKLNLCTYQILFNNLFKITNQDQLINVLLTINNQYGSTSDGTPFVNVDLYDKDFLNETIDENFFEKRKYMKNILKNSQFLDIKKIKLPRVLKYTDRISMYYGIETRLPFLDHKLFEFNFNLPNHYKFNQNISRWIFKKIFKLKFKLANNKRSIVDPQAEWMKTYFKNNILDIINSSYFKNLGYFNVKKIQEYYNNYLKGQSDSSFALMQIISSYYFFKNFNSSGFEKFR